MTLWEMRDAYKGRMHDEWERHARMYALTANINRDAKRNRKPFESRQFNPFAAPLSERTQGRVKVSMGALMSAMFDRDGSQMAKELTDGQRWGDSCRKG